jgi:hypothetical protein
LCDVIFYFFEIDIHDSDDEAARAVVHVHLRIGVDVKLLHNGGSPIDDVDFAKRNIGDRFSPFARGWVRTVGMGRTNPFNTRTFSNVLIGTG